MFTAIINPGTAWYERSCLNKADDPEYACCVFAWFWDLIRVGSQSKET